jgi:protein-S-isoprenylcysteine O-methyltransferase Ste14
MSRALGLLYGFVSYAIGMASLFYAVFFLNNWLVPITIDGGADADSSVTGRMLLINLALCSLFAVQHSVMARAGFKRVLTRLLPRFAERSTYVLATGIVLTALYVFWQPMPAAVWSVETPALRTAIYALQVGGWTLLVAATFMLNHFELFGLSQVSANARGQQVPTPVFREPLMYRFVRHPIQLGVLIAFWANPDMSQGLLLLNVSITGYILVALRFFEEPYLVAEFGKRYTEYQSRVGMLLPRLRRTGRRTRRLTRRRTGKGAVAAE